jgi:superfamily I DNA/RNA helicase
MSEMINERATGTLDGIGLHDHSITSEYWVLGPPGTGKTTSTSKLVRQAVLKYGPNSVLVTSFSRAAAAELANCDLPINPDNLGTLHSFCYRALDRPKIAEAHVHEWNALHPHLGITPVITHGRLHGDDSVEETYDNVRTGDSLLRELNRYRGLEIDAHRWPANIREFDQMWTRYKRGRGLLDFCDLIDICLKDVPVAPGNPSVLFADEAQDLNAMQLKLTRKWGGRAEYFVLAFDDDQTIYSFIGAAPDALLEIDIPDDHKVVLRQSHRVPRNIHNFADRLIRQVSRRHEKIHIPRPAAGAVHRLCGTYKSPEYAILSSATKHLEQGKTIMFLASCSYMLQPIIQVLRKNSIPFHNPYRKSNGLWNPVRIGPRSISRRILSLLIAHPAYGEDQRQWTFRDVALWAECLRGDVLKTGVRERLESADPKQPATVEQLAEILTPGALSSLLATLDGNWRALLEWWRARISAEYYNRIQFPASVVAQRGLQTLVEDPRVVLGTIHSVKGGEADVVYLFPDLSRAGDAHYQRFGPDRDSIIRVFYVGATRARETLCICQAAGPLAVSL